jgi:cell division protein FtsB
MIIVTGKIIWNNLQFNKEIKKIQAQINKLEEENTLLSEQILYLQTDSFKEKLARERLGLVKPGEKVLVIPPEKKPIELPKPIEAPKEPENWQKWFDYFFKKTS